MQINVILQWAAILAVLAGCLFVLSALPAKPGAGFSRAQLQDWMEAIGESKVGWLVRFNIAGALISFATVVLFFVGNASLFGVYTLAAVLSLGLGAFVTKAISGAIGRLPGISESLESDKPDKATVAAIVWTPDTWGRRASELTKWISICNLFGILWLEFAFMSDMGGRLMGLSSLERVGLLFLVSSVVLYACFRFGVRGIAILDLLLTPLILFGLVIILIGTGLLAFDTVPTLTASTLLEPKLPLAILALFVVHVFCLNPFLVVVTEGHWFRMWAFGKPEQNQQVPGLVVVAVASVVMVAIGLLAGVALPGEPGDALIARLLTKLDSQLPIFAAAFWVAGVAAMFSTADVQILGLALNSSFNRNQGTSSLSSGILTQPAVSAFLLASALAVLYYVVRIHFKLDFEKLVFFILPAAITILPALIFRLTRVAWRGLNYAVVALGLAFYLVLSLIGLFRPADQLALNLAAVLVPVTLSAAIWLSRSKHLKGAK